MLPAVLESLKAFANQALNVWAVVELIAALAGVLTVALIGWTVRHAITAAKEAYTDKRKDGGK